MATNNLHNYFRGQQLSLQWSPVLRALAAEMSSHSDSKDLRQLFFKIGKRFAKDTEGLFQDAQTIAQLEESLNDFWFRTNCGWVDLNEADGCIYITHQAAPLAEAFGDDALEWVIGLLEGFYQSVFNVLGASDALVVRSVAELTDGMNIRLRFGLEDQ